MKVIIEIEVQEVEQWNVDWHNGREANSELNILNRHAKEVISEHLGIDLQSITVQSKLIK